MSTVSVVVPTRNRRALLAATLRSVLRQQNVDLEVIVVDEGSTDDTPAMLAAVQDPRVRVVRHDVARGLSSARNRGAAESRGDWLAFVDDDDLWAPGKLSNQLQAAHVTGRDWAYTGSVTIGGEGEIVGGERPLSPERVVSALPRFNAIPGGGSNVIVRRRLLMDVGPFDARLRSAEDWEMWIRLAKVSRPAWVCSPLLAYRVHASNWSLDIGEMIRAVRFLEELHHTRVDWGKLHRWLAESSLRSRRRGAAVAHFARAAVHGSAMGVARDFSAIARRRVDAAWRGRARYEPPDPTWIQQATCWLGELQKAD